MFMVCVYGVQPMTVNYITGTGNMKRGILLSLSRQGFFLIPLLILIPMFWGLNGVLFAGPTADFMACVLFFVMVTVDFEKLDGIQRTSGQG